MDIKQLCSHGDRLYAIDYSGNVFVRTRKSKIEKKDGFNHLYVKKEWEEVGEVENYISRTKISKS